MENIQEYDKEEVSSLFQQQLFIIRVNPQRCTWNQLEPGNADIERAVQRDHSYIQIGTRKFLLIEAEKVRDSDRYEVTDPDEDK
jgi:hypothetical protein